MKVPQSCPSFCNPMDCSSPASSVHGIFHQEYWSGLPFPSPGGLPNPGMEPESPGLQADSLPSEAPGKHMCVCVCVCVCMCACRVSICLYIIPHLMHIFISKC